MCLHVLKLLAHLLPVTGSSLFAGFKLFELDRKVGTSALPFIPDFLHVLFGSREIVLSTEAFLVFVLDPEILQNLFVIHILLFLFFFVFF